MIFAFMKGKPEVLYRATDYKGNVCGQYLKTDNMLATIEIFKIQANA